jgi:hypothetical protein
MILAGLDRLISPEPLWPGRADPMGLVLGLGLTTEEANIFPNSYPQFSYANFMRK